MKSNISKFKNNLSVIVLCGGKGQRLRPLTQKTPKPLIKIGKKTILEHIINHFIRFNLKNIVVVTGYKHNLIKNFVFQKYKNKNIKVYNTGVQTNILNRIKKILKITNKYVLLCYGDTLVDVNINKLIKFYSNNKNKVIITSYQLKSDFGILNIDKNNNIVQFKEKPILDIWFNIGYFLFSNKYFQLIKGFDRFENFLTYVVNKKKMKTFKHKGEHITVNTISQLEDAKVQIKKFFK